MDRIEVNEGARIIGADGITVGVVDMVDTASQPPTLLVRLAGSDQVAGVTARDVDFRRTTTGEVHLAIAGADLLRSVEATTEHDEGHMTFPVHGEQLELHVQERPQGRVVIHRRVETHQVEQEIELEREVVKLEHVPVGEEVDDIPLVREEGDTTVVPVVEEVLVVEKRLRLVEEIRITKRIETSTETIRNELRREVVEVDEKREKDRP